MRGPPEIVGKMSGDCFNIYRADCGNPTKNLYLGGDPVAPRRQATCEVCMKVGIYRFDAARWRRLPLEPEQRQGR